MSRYTFKNINFVTSAYQAKGFPTQKNKHGEFLPEVAIVGRSNAGKSSLINHIFNNKKIAKVSSTPGKTQLLNFFDINNEFSFVDLPGYGFAKTPGQVRKHWGQIIRHYLETRSQLKVILLLIDIRRRPNSDDLELLNWLIENDKAVILVITKADKIVKSKRAAEVNKIVEAFNVDNLHHTLYSVTKNIGKDSLTHLIRDALIDEVDEEISTNKEASWDN